MQIGDTVDLDKLEMDASMPHSTTLSTALVTFNSGGTKIEGSAIQDMLPKDDADLWVFSFQEVRDVGRQSR